MSHHPSHATSFVRSMRFKIALLVLVPLVLLTVVGARVVLTAWSESAAAGHITEVIEVCADVSALVHETQKERGFTAGYLGSGGQKFGPELSRQRGRVDEQAAALAGDIEAIGSATLAGDLGDTLAAALNDLERIGAVRGRVSSQQIPLAEALGYYTKMNGRFLDAVGEARKMRSTPAVNRAVSAYAVFLLGKERAGIERAVLSNAFARDAFPDGGYAKLVRLISEQDTYLSEYQHLADAAGRRAYGEQMRAPLAAVQAFRAVAHAKAFAGGFDRDASAWFAAATARINALKAIDDSLAKDILGLAEDTRGRAAAAMGLAVIGTLGTLVLLGVGGGWGGGGGARPGC